MSNSTSDNQEMIFYIIVIVIAFFIFGGGADRNEEKTTQIKTPQNGNRLLEYKGGGAASGDSTANPKSYTWDDVASLKQQTIGNLDATDRLLN
ncbi:MAG: hypothetical protein AB2809_13295 [Candidatus Thiodiazotropha sp.]